LTILDFSGNDPMLMVPYNLRCSIPDFWGRPGFDVGTEAASGHAEARITS
jgi:hypothetical protein